MGRHFSSRIVQKQHLWVCISCYRPFPPLGRPFAAPFEFGFLGKGRSSIAQTYFASLALSSSCCVT